ncbi:hypothetical protein [Nocardioides currus]|uniref:Uncharacterized protein n=1 Tax=Nocardioides currus TaxID=2133958 RepID=A0A2R7Z0E0_9ACTN|nr:hypothetical protein [Nocardioides currus]PUA82088.1 hypothetical protein C7S10_08705 [Nocardioides currus]
MNTPADPLQALLEHVIRDRTALAEGRRARLGVQATDEARARMVHSLEAYTDALQASHLPVPYRLRDELRTHRSACRPGALAYVSQLAP